MKEIRTKELKEKIDSGEKINLIDIREEDEVIEGKIKEAKVIPMSEIMGRLDELDKDKEYYIICRSGNRSFKICMLLEEDFKVVNVAGGMEEWHGKVE